MALPAQMAAFCSGGDVLTAASARNVSAPFLEFVDKFAEHYIPELLKYTEKHGGIHEYKNAWKPGLTASQVYTPVHTLAFASVEHTCNSPSIKQFLSDHFLADEDKRPFNDVIEAAKKLFVDHTTPLVSFSSSQKKKQKGISRVFAYLLHMIRAACCSVDDVMNLHRLISYPDSIFEQRNSSFKVNFGNINFIKAISGEANNVFNLWRSKCAYERFLLTSLRASHKSNRFLGLYHGIKDSAGNWVEEPDHDYVNAFNWFIKWGFLQSDKKTGKPKPIEFPSVNEILVKSVQKSKKPFSLSNMKMRKSTFDSRVEIATEKAILCDAIKACVEYGLDPVVPESKDKEENDSVGTHLEPTPKNTTLIKYLEIDK